MITADIKVETSKVEKGTENSTEPAQQPVQAPPTSWQQLKAMAKIVVTFPKILLALLENQNRIAQAIGTNAAVLNRLNAKLAYFEHTIPMIGKAGAQFEHHERKEYERIIAREEYAKREQRRAEMAVAQ